jgi:hypothetical protein
MGFRGFRSMRSHIYPKGARRAWLRLRCPARVGALHDARLGEVRAKRGAHQRAPVAKRAFAALSL